MVTPQWRHASDRGDRVPVPEGQQFGWGAGLGSAVEHRAQAGICIGVRHHQLADRLVELASGTKLVGDAQGLQPAKGLLGEMGVIEDDQVGGLGDGAAVEVDPVVHHTDGLGLMVVVEFGAAVFPCGEADDIQSQHFGFVFNPLGELPGTGQVRH